MGIFSQVLNRLGFSNNAVAERSPITVFLLDDDVRRHEWFAKRFAGDHLDIAEDVETARELLENHSWRLTSSSKRKTVIGLRSATALLLKPKRFST